MALRLGIDVAVERDEEGSADSEKEDTVSQRGDRARVVHNPPPRRAILAAGTIFSGPPLRIQRGDDNNGQRDEQLHDEENLGQPLITTSQVLRDVIPVVGSKRGKAGV